MIHDHPVVQAFAKLLSERLPELTASLSPPIQDDLGNHILLNAPWPADPERCQLVVLFSGDGFGVMFNVAEVDCPAWCDIAVGANLARAAETTVEFVRQIISERILIEVRERGFPSLGSGCEAVFREASAGRTGKVVETIRWRGEKQP